MNLKPNSTLALAILIISTFSHPILSLINLPLLETFVKFFNRVSSTRGFFCQPWQNFNISCRYLIPNDWKYIRIWIRLLQNLLLTHNNCVFRKVYFWAGSLFIGSHFRIGLNLCQSSWCHLRKCSLFWFLGFLSVHL